MPLSIDLARSLIGVLDEPALIVEGSRTLAANAAARNLLGQRIEGTDVRIAIRHPRRCAPSCRRTRRSRAGRDRLAGPPVDPDRPADRAGQDAGAAGRPVRRPGRRSGCGSISSPMPATSCARRWRRSSAMPKRCRRRRRRRGDPPALRLDHPRRGQAHAADRRGFDEPVADRGRPLHGPARGRSTSASRRGSPPNMPRR